MGGVSKKHGSELSALEKVRPGSSSVLERFAGAPAKKDFDALDQLNLDPIREVPIGKELVGAARDHFFKGISKKNFNYS